MSCFLGDTDPIPYPCAFPIKIMGLKRDDFAQAISETILVHDEKFDPETLELRVSKNGTYLSVTATVMATSREQLDNIYLALSKHPFVKVVL